MNNPDSMQSNMYQVKNILFYFIFFILVGFLACGKDQKYSAEQPPVSKDTFLLILKDIKTVDALMSTRLYEKDSFVADPGYLRKSVFDKYGIDENTFNRAVGYYFADPEKISAFFKIISDTLLKEQRLLQKQTDSLKNE